ncbi:diguanylate cyclase [Cystobacter ferrugineus]|uniref:diguanylate cyclase n=1 Tax=Cystobacter ferrugineus TaxID=83449 RepID=A0A1L9AVQ2_9BACT|nr:diguanylate cyclase [Cystobacter ferrugineus]OJH34077.1 diguanylate cyclase response regulator [Cystobacter ferrugineus]
MGLRHTKKAEQALTVLVVEPRATDLEQTRMTLGEAGFRVVPVTRFDAASPLFEAIRPDAVVLAAQGPDFAAVQVARRLLQMCRGTVPILYLVDPLDMAAVRHCLDKGQGVDVVTRSSLGEELVLRLRAQLRLRSAVRQAMLPTGGHSSEALRDPLTGLYNRTFLLELIALEIRRIERFGGSFSLVAGSLDDFRALRKESGHGIAERLLVYSSVVFGQTVREADVVARVGEEEFMVLLPATPAEGVPDVMTRVRERFALARLQVEGRVLRPSLTLGSVSYPDMVGSPMQLLNGALQSLRKARDTRRSAELEMMI